MPMPPEIAQASVQFMDLLGALKERAWLQTHNQCYAMLRAVLHEFRQYLTVRQAIAVADALPAVTRAIFVEDWAPCDEPPAPPAPEEFTAAVVRRLSPHHVPPDSIVADVFAVLAPRCNAARLGPAVDALPSELRNLWREQYDRRNLAGSR
jgi:uncharacterized protein (DUF2267 family)